MIDTPAGRLTSNQPTSYPLWLPTGRQVLSLLLAGCCATVLYARVYATFDRVRIMAVMTEQQAFEGAVVVPLPDVSRLAGLPTALILDLRNAAPDPRVVSVTLAGSELARILLDPGEDVRADLSLPADAGITRGDRLELEADGDRWSLRQLEIANSHGFSRGLFAFVIVPSPADQYQSPPAIVLLLVFIVLLGLPVSSFQRGGLNVARPVHLALAGAALFIFGTTLIIAFVSQYKILLSGQAFLLCLAIIYYPALQRSCGLAFQRLVSGRDTLGAAMWSHLPRDSASRLAVALDAFILAYLLALLLFLLTGGFDFGWVRVNRTMWLLVTLALLVPIRLAMPKPFVFAQAFRTRAVKDVLFAVLVTRVAMFAVAFYSNVLFPGPEPDSWSLPFRHARIVEVFAAWDAGWYFSIARNGYYASSVGESSIPFFPLYPLLMRAVAWVLGGSDAAIWIAGIGISVAAFVGALLALHRFTERMFGDGETARRAVLYLAVFPFSFFLTTVYAESLFHLLTILAMSAAHRSRWWPAGIWGGLAALARPYGILLAVPLTCFALAGRPSVRELARRGTAVLLVPLGLAAYCLYVYTLTGNPLAWLEANRHWDYTLGHAPGQRLLEFFSTLWRSPYNVLVNPAELYQLFHATTGVLFLTLTPWVFTRVGVPFGAYVLATLLIPLTGSQLEGIGRYSANLFPVFMLLATFRSPRVYDALLVVFSLLLALFVGLFVNWHPIY